MLNATHDELVKWLGCASIGVSSMIDEHFGINVVEMMVRLPWRSRALSSQLNSEIHRLLVSYLLRMLQGALYLTLWYRTRWDYLLGFCMRRMNTLLYSAPLYTRLYRCLNLSNLHCARERERRLRSFGQTCLSKDSINFGTPCV